jgi:ketosteroid isomerase-like protein
MTQPKGGMTWMRTWILVILGLVWVNLATRSTAASGTAEDVLAFEKEMEAAVVRGDVKFLDRICASDFSFTHGDGSTSGGQPLRVENRVQWLAAVSKRPYLSRDLDQVQVELHGDIAITYGMYRARYSAPADPKRADFTVWFERVYALRNGQWQYVSHRTVHGPTYEAGTTR